MISWFVLLVKLSAYVHDRYDDDENLIIIGYSEHFSNK